MDKQVKKIWLAALKSGKYLQGQGSLRSKAQRRGGCDGYCCLGVLCDLYISHKNKTASWRLPGLKDDGLFGFNANRGNDEFSLMALPPAAVTGWACLTIENQMDLTDINDQDRVPGSKNFAEVIQAIELIETADVNGKEGRDV